MVQTAITDHQEDGRNDPAGQIRGLLSYLAWLNVEDILNVGSSCPCETIQAKREGQSAERRVVEPSLGRCTTSNGLPSLLLIQVFLMVIDRKTEQSPESKTPANQDIFGTSSFT